MKKLALMSILLLSGYGVFATGHVKHHKKHHKTHMAGKSGTPAPKSTKAPEKK